MQKTLTILVLALTLSCVIADYTAISEGWAKAPVPVCDDTDIRYSNSTNLVLSGMSTSDVSLTAQVTVSKDPNNRSNSIWSAFIRTIDTKTLSTGSDASYLYRASQISSIIFGYAVALDVSNDTYGIPQIWLYQTKIGGASELPRVALTSNYDSRFTPMMLGATFNANTIFLFYAVSAWKVNFTSINIGTTVRAREFTLTTSYNISMGGPIQAAWGKSLYSSQVYAGWREFDVYKVAVVDFNSGSLTNSAPLGSYSKNYTCSHYATDKKYGVWCVDYSRSYPMATVYISNSNSNNLAQLFSFNSSSYRISSSFSYAHHLGFIYRDSSIQNSSVLSYDIWDVEELKTIRNRTNYLIFDPATSRQQIYTIHSSGQIYTLLYNDMSPNATRTKMQVGLLIDPPVPSNLPYYTLVIGILMTVISGAIILFR